MSKPMPTDEPEDEQPETAEQYPGILPGQRVADTQEEAKHLRVLARTPHTAENAHISALGKSVAEVNDCPPDAPVYLAVYESDLDERFGDRWQDWSGPFLAYHVGNHGLRTYSFPSTRLEKAEDRDPEKWQEAAQDDGA